MTIIEQKKTRTEKSGSKPNVQTGLRHLDFASIQQDLISVTEEIHHRYQLSLMEKMKGFFQSESNEHPLSAHIDGRELAKVIGTKEAFDLQNALVSHPEDMVKRSQLVKLVLRSRQSMKLHQYRNLLIQGCLPVYIGYITPIHLQLAAQVYQLYLKKVIYFCKKALLTVRSKQLGGVNVNMISLQDILNSVENGEESDDAQLVHELQVAYWLLDKSSGLIKNMRAQVTIPVDLSDLNQFDPKPSENAKFLGDPNNIRVIPDKRALMFRKVFSVLDIMKEIYPLHALGLRVSARMQQIEDKMPQPFLMEGRIRMEGLKQLTLRLRSGDASARMGLRPSFNRILDVYRKALKRSSVRNPQEQDVPILAEFVQLTLFAHSHRIILDLDLARMRQLLGASKKAIDSVVLVDGHYLSLQMKLDGILRKYGI